jgi:mutator protein MutT
MIVAVLGLPINNKGQYLLTQRHQPKDPEVHMKWQLAGGGMEDGETPEQTLSREMQEELGVSVRILFPHPIVKTHFWKMKSSQYHVALVCYLVSIGDQKPQIVDEETHTWKWCSLGEAMELDSLPLTRDILEEAEKLKPTLIS